MPIIFNHIADILKTTDVNLPHGDPSKALPNILKIVFALSGAVSLLIITIAALRMVLSQGNPDSINRARNTILYAVLGLIISVFAFTIVAYVIKRI